MANNNVVINLAARKDVDGQTFYVGKIKAPVLIDCRDGATFLIFISDPGDESLQISLMDSKSKNSED